MALVPLRLACDAREDVLAGGLTGNHFAAQLDKVVRAPEDYPVYGDADEFFAITYPTTGLRALLTRAFGRVTGAKGVAGENGILRPTTSFGGGKTHDLTAIYHLAKGSRPADLASFMDTSVLPGGPVQVAALVGDALDPVAGVVTNGHRTVTLWGEMAAQIGDEAYTVLAENDRTRSAPGTHTILQAFAGQPTIVIIDEIAQHLRQLTSSGDPDVRRSAQAIPVFLKNLFEVASDPSNRVIVVITLAARTNAFGNETDELTEMLDEAAEQAAATLSETADILARSISPSAVIRPADDQEIGEILKRRLFARIDPDAARAAGRAYQELYETLARTEDLAGGAEHPASYAAQVERYYPFHPELVRVLDKRLGDIPQFQRARGALKLLAEVVHHVYLDGDDTAVINVGDIDYSDAPVLNHLTHGLSRGEFESVATADFAGPTSHAAALDRRVFPGKPPYATRVARTVFTHSLEMVATAGASRADWILGTLRPGEDPSLVEKALTEADKSFWHLSFDGARWRFNVEPNVNAIIESEKQNIPNTQVSRVLDDLITTAFANDGGVTTILFPAGPADVPDQTALRLVVLHHDLLSITSKDAGTPPALLGDILRTTGSSGTLRKYRNAVVFALADTTTVDAMKDRVRAKIAADVLAADTARMAQFGQEIRKKIEAYQKQATLEARVAITRCYKHVYYPYNDKSTGYLRHRELPAQQQGDTKTATVAVLTVLADEQKIRDTTMSAAYLKSRAWPDTQPSITTQDIRDTFWKDHSLPIIRDVSGLRTAITNGISNDGWVYWDATTGKTYTAQTMSGLSVAFRADTHLMTLAEATQRGLLVRKPTQGDLKAVLTGPTTTGAHLRTALETRCGGEPSKGDVLDVLATAVQAGEYRTIVVTDHEPGPGVRALTPTQIRDKGLDTLHVMTRAHADHHQVTFSERVVTGKTFTETGPGGMAIQAITDKVTDFTIQTITRLVVRTTADNVRGISDLDLLVIALGMLPRHHLTVTLDVAAEYPGLTGGLEFQGTADRTTFQSLYTHLGKTLKAAKAVEGGLSLEFIFTPAVTVSDQQWTQLHKVIKDLQIKHVEITAEVTK